MNQYDRRLQVIYFAILMSTLIYGAIAWTSTNAAVPAKTLPDELRMPMTIGLYAAAVVAFVIAMIIHARRLLIVRWAMLEAACICGLVAAFVTAIGAYMPSRGFLLSPASSRSIRGCEWGSGRLDGLGLQSYSKLPNRAPSPPQKAWGRRRSMFGRRANDVACLHCQLSILN